MKRAEIDDLLAVALLITLLSALLVVSMAGRQSQLRSQTLAEASRAERNLVSASAITSAYVTDSGIPVAELLGDYLCYGSESPDYGAGIRPNAFAEISGLFDSVHGRGNWMLEIKKAEAEAKQTPYMFFIDVTSSMTEPHSLGQPSNFEAVSQAALRIVDDPVIIKSSSVTQHAQVACSIQPERFTDFDNPRQAEENWPGWVTLVAEIGPIDENGGKIEAGWGDEMLVFISSDELACSTGPTSRYVETAVDKASAAGIRVYFLKPPRPIPGTSLSNPLGTPEDMREYEEGVASITSGTGGRIIEITDVDSLAEELRKVIRAKTSSKTGYLTSEGIVSEQPAVGDGSVFEFTFPLPCSAAGHGKYRLYVKG
ncbi:MAG: hypothetical protein HY544_05510 [Candidatus Diapherotrites archaeon]|uniref:VWA domain-containing protein n=1 Tax=Candidatus Iainarchaeum sp. TaxID=3101447 RepID=A0A8T3YPK4_9ARCH|nr:hypothetical protein [Candidatus Diapherotrites archaeon]